jgi:hypothetical protein
MTSSRRHNRRQIEHFRQRVSMMVLVYVGLSLMLTQVAVAETPTSLCVPEVAGKAIVSANKEGKCTKRKYTALQVPGSGELESLDKILPYIKYISSGVGGMPTIQFSGANVQIVDGAGRTEFVNGAGNLIIGYDEGGRGVQTGSHNLFVGGGSSYTSYGGIVAGFENTISAPFASVVGGEKSTASGLVSSVSGGLYGRASGEVASVTGGYNSIASGQQASVTGGYSNTASGVLAIVGGGEENEASGEVASVTGGLLNSASGQRTTVTGGTQDSATGADSSIFGGRGLEAPGEFETLP